jgi:hypothetical protein
MGGGLTSQGADIGTRLKKKMFERKGRKTWNKVKERFIQSGMGFNKVAAFSEKRTK